MAGGSAQQQLVALRRACFVHCLRGSWASNFALNQKHGVGFWELFRHSCPPNMVYFDKIRAIFFIGTKAYKLTCTQNQNLTPKLLMNTNPSKIMSHPQLSNNVLSDFSFYSVYCNISFWVPNCGWLTVPLNPHHCISLMRRCVHASA